MTDNELAIWICTLDLQKIWANSAAEKLWQQRSGSIPLSGSSEQIVAYAKNGKTCSLRNPEGRLRHFNGQPLPDGNFLFSELSAPSGKPTLAELVASEHRLVSIYDPMGELIEQTRPAQCLFDRCDIAFEDRFSDPAAAHDLWAQALSSEISEGYLQIKTIDGFRWYFLVLKKVSLNSSEWVVRVQAYDADDFLQREKGLQSSLREQEVIFENAGTGICYVRGGEQDSRLIMRCNKKFADIFGYDVSELIGQSSRIFYKNGNDFKALGNSAYPLLNRGDLFTQRSLLRRKDGSLFWAQLRGKIISLQHPQMGYMWVIEDINDYIQANQALELAVRDQNLVLDHAMVGIVFLRDRKVTRCNQRFEEIFGYEPGELQGVTSRTWYLTDEAWEAAGEACYAPLSRGEVFEDEMLLAGKGGKPIWCDVRSKAIDPKDLSRGSIWITMDITERKKADEALEKVHAELEKRVEERTRKLAQTVNELNEEIAERKIAEERVKHMALHDALTGLPNRILLENRLNEALQRCSGEKSMLAVVFIDLDRFKMINDSWGHHEGDQLLIEVAGRLRELVDENDTVSRLGGDEFVLLFPSVKNQGEVEQRIHKLQRAFADEVYLAYQGVYVTPSIGVSLYPDHADNGADLLKKADSAMYQAKEQGRNCARFYTEEIGDHLSGQAELGNELFRALKSEDFILYYQPQVDSRAGRIVGAEALIRWHHQEKGLIPPSEFIPVAEDTGLIVELGYWILHSACSQLISWKRKGVDDLVLSVNLSSLQVQQPSFAENLFQIIDQYGVNPSSLELELTESILMKNTEETIATLERLHRRGIKISVDDFGTGYSSLSYLKRLPIDKLKIDRSFVSEITTDQDDALICRTIISMAKNLNLELIAEGVEHQSQLDLLTNYGCELYQGYLYSKPVPIHQFDDLLQENRVLTDNTA